MSVQVFELIDSGTGSVSQDWESGEVRECTRRFVIGQADGFNGAVDGIQDYAPRYLAGGYGPFWTRRKLDVKPIGNKYYEISATYSTLLPTLDYSDGGGGGGGGGSSDPLAGSIAWDTTGHTEHITQAYKTTVTPGGGNSPQIYDAINVSGDGVQGLDVVRPSLRYSETWIAPASLALTGDFVSAVYQLTGTVNKTKFRYFEPGEALFVGARAQWQGGDPFVAVTFDFECRPNNDLVYVNGITGVKKKGWEYMWIMYEPEESADRLVRMPKFAFVQEVYEEKDWSSLLIPGITPAKAKTPKNNKAVRQAVNAFLAN
jgi:hypothetical protein